MSGIIVVGRTDAKTREYGDKASILFGHSVETGDEVSFDVSRPHITLIAGKRGSGKSYSQSGLIEGISLLPDEIRKEIAVVVMDTMGIFWSLKYPNRDTRELSLLRELSLEPKGCDVEIFVPEHRKSDYTIMDHTFSLRPSEITPEDWCLTFELDQNSPQGICITRAIRSLREEVDEYSMDDLILRVKADRRAATQTQEALENRLEGSKQWGIFGEDGLSVDSFIRGGSISVIDMSRLYYSAQTWNVRSLAVSLLAEKIMDKMVQSRKGSQMSNLSDVEEKEGFASQVWIFIDEAHQFLPSGRTTAASWSLKRVIREGRQPGLSMVLATQQPGKLDTDVITQSDIVVSHHITSKVDIDGLNKIMNTYQKKSIVFSLGQLEKKPGAALVIDDTREAIEMIQVRPKMTMHAGDSPDILRKLYDVL